MNTKIFLIYDFKKIIFEKDNKIKIICKYINKNDNKNKNQIICNNKKNIIILYNWKRYLSNAVNNNFLFIILYLINTFANKTGKYLSQKFIFKKENSDFKKIFSLSSLI